MNRVPVFDTLATARLLYSDSPVTPLGKGPDALKACPSAIDAHLMRLFATMCRTPFGKRLLTTNPAGAFFGQSSVNSRWRWRLLLKLVITCRHLVRAAASRTLLEMFVSATESPVGLAALRTATACLPQNPPHLMALLSQLLPLLRDMLDRVSSCSSCNHK